MFQFSASTSNVLCIHTIVCWQTDTYAFDLDTCFFFCLSYCSLYREEFWNVEIPKIPVINTTGSGDATVGGFAHSLEQNYPLKECVRYAEGAIEAIAEEPQTAFPPAIIKEEESLNCSFLPIK